MIEQARSVGRQDPEKHPDPGSKTEAPKSAPNPANHRHLSPTTIRGLRPKEKQYLVWDAWEPGQKRGDNPARGLCILVSPKGAMSYRVAYYEKVLKEGKEKPVVMTRYVDLGRVRRLALDDDTELQSLRDDQKDTRRLELEIKHARRRCEEIRAGAEKGQDPKADDPKRSGLFENEFKYFIQVEQKDGRQLKSADKTEVFVLKRCAALRSTPIAQITAQQIDTLLRQIGSIEGRRASAVRVFAHLQDFFNWCRRPGGSLRTSPMDGMKSPYKLKGRDQFYSDDEIKAIWQAADKLDVARGGYVKLILLLALRREELAQAKWSEFDDQTEPKLFKVPFERTKGKVTRKRKTTYLVPLPPMAQRLVKRLRNDGEMVFPRIDMQRLKSDLVLHGAPKDFKLHVARHTIATWMQNHGKSIYEIALVLNHASSGVTAGYSHGDATEPKRKLLTEWAEHIGALMVQSKGGVEYLG